MYSKTIINTIVIFSFITLSIGIICAGTAYGMYSSLNRCTLSRNSLYTLSNFYPLRNGPIVNNTLLYIQDKTFNFSVSCPIYEKTPYVILKSGYLIPIYTYEIDISYNGNIITIHYKFKDLEKGNYSLHFINGDNQCIFNTNNTIDSHIPYKEKDIFPITNLTFSDRHEYHSSFPIQDPSFVLLASSHPFILTVNWDDNEGISSYNISGYYVSKHYFANIIYSGTLNNTNITLTVTGKKIMYWINNENVFYNNTTFYDKKCYHYLNIPVTFIIVIVSIYWVITISLISLHVYFDNKGKTLVKDEYTEINSGDT